MKILCLLDKPDVVRPNDQWLWNYIPSEGNEVDFFYAPPATDQFAKWGKLLAYYPAYCWHGARALRKTMFEEYDMVVAWEGKNGFPYAFWRSMIGQKSPPVVILAFNLRGVINHFQQLAAFGMQSVARAVVFTPAEVETYQQRLSMPPGSVTFCPQGWYDLQAYKPAISVQMPKRFLFASGRSYRDYATLARAVDGLDVTVCVSAREFNMAGIEMPNSMQATGWLSTSEFQAYLLQSQFYIVPLLQIAHAGGDSSLMQAMSAGKAVVATRAPSTELYIQDGKNGILVPPGDVEAMRNAIAYLWNHPNEAKRMGEEARRRYEEKYTFEKFALRVNRILQEVYYEYKN